VRITVAYSQEDDLKPLKPLLESKVNKGITLDVVKVKEDDLKFNHHNYDLFYSPIPLINHVRGIRFLTNGAKVWKSIGIEGNCNEGKICVQGSNSTEFYFLKMFYRGKLSVSLNQECGCRMAEGGSVVELTPFWSDACGDLPFVVKLLGTVTLNDDTLAKVKVAVRESASMAQGRGDVDVLSKELGLRGRQALECFIKRCSEAGLCIKPEYYLL
jgi:hypothetical protein